MIVYPTEEVLCSAEIRKDKETGEVFIAVTASEGAQHSSALRQLGKVETGMMGDRCVIKPE
jgi:hypothetical protein